ncbi:MAG: hypothetical protein ABIR98_06285 [Usitatibacter sp.]
MSTPGNDAQRDLERRALRNVRRLVDKIENTDEADAQTQKRLLAAIVIGALLVAAAIAAAVVFTRERHPPVVIDPSRLPPVQAGPRR